MFYKPSQGSSRSMQSCMCCHIRIVLQMVCNIWSCACQCGPSRGWLTVRIILLWLSWFPHDGFHLLYFGVVYLYKMRFQHLGLPEKYWRLRSVPEGPPFNFLSSNFSGGGSEVVGEFYIIVNFCAGCWGFSSTHSSWWYPLLSPGC